nr:hypothetical protein 1 - Desulfovibrio vulgaris (strain Miyazaki) [Nitratidesulfovibrio vulgaris]
MFLQISTDFTPTPGIPPPSPELKSSSIKAIPRLSRGISPLTYQTAYVRFTPSDSD